MEQHKLESSFTLLDGGMGRELLRMGAPFRQPEWSALALMEAPQLVRNAHENFAMAGCDILTTNSYAIVPYHIGENRFFQSGTELAARSGRLAAEVAKKYDCQVAGCLPPLFGSYRPDLFDAALANDLLQVLVKGLDPYVDVWLAETLSSIAEASVVLETLRHDQRPVWVANTLMDDGVVPQGEPRLRSGERVVEAVRSAVSLGADAILFNCSQPEVMSPAVKRSLQELRRLDAEIPVGVYANAFEARGENGEANLTIHEIRPEVDNACYVALADEWRSLGATIIGGCCGIGPEHIRSLSNHMKKIGWKSSGSSVVHSRRSI